MKNRGKWIPFNRTHLNKCWTFFLEVFVLIHAVAVAIYQGQAMWPMFAFGFGAMLILTQMHGLGLSSWTKRGLAIGFLPAVVGYYALSGKIGAINEVLRIPLIDYTLIFLFYVISLLINRIMNLFQRPVNEPAATD